MTNAGQKSWQQKTIAVLLEIPVVIAILIKDAVFVGLAIAVLYFFDQYGIWIVHGEVSPFIDLLRYVEAIFVVVFYIVLVVRDVWRFLKE